MIKVWRTNGLSQEFGVPSGPYQEYSFQPGELITAMSLWGNGAGNRLGAIKFKTNKGNEFFPKMTREELKQEYPTDIGSGICIGIEVQEGEAIDSMGFVFVKPLESSTMADVNYPTIGFEQAKVEISTLKSVEYDKASTRLKSMNWKFQRLLLQRRIGQLLQVWNLPTKFPSKLEYQCSLKLKLTSVSRYRIWDLWNGKHY